MNTNLLTIDNMLFAGTAVAAPPAPKPNTFTNATRFSPSADDTPPPPNTPEPSTTDNAPFIAQNEPINKPAQDFRHTLRETAATEAPPQDQDNTKPEKQDSASAIPSEANPTQSLSTPETPIIPGVLVKEAATKMEPKTGRQLAQLIANLKDGKSPPVTGQAAKAAEIKPLVTTDKGQPGPKIVLPDTSNDQSGLQAVLSNTSEGTADTQPLPATSRGKNTDKIPISNSTVVPTKGPTDGENAKELMSDALVDADSKTTTTNEEAATTDKSAIPGNEKAPALNTNFPTAQTKFTEPQSQPVRITPEKSTRLANKPSESKAAAPEILSESSGGSGKESPRAGNKLSDNPPSRYPPAKQKTVTVQPLIIALIQTSNKYSRTTTHKLPLQSNPPALQRAQRASICRDKLRPAMSLQTLANRFLNLFTALYPKKCKTSRLQFALIRRNWGRFS